MASPSSAPPIWVQTGAPKAEAPPAPVPCRVQYQPPPSQTKATSGWLSPEISPDETAVTLEQVLSGPMGRPLVTVKLPVPLFCRIDKVSSPLFAVTRSTSLSPFRSTEVIAKGVMPVLLAELTAPNPPRQSPFATE